MPQQLDDATYDAFQIWRGRVRRNGIVMMPTAGPSPQPATPVIVDGGIEYEIVTCTAARKGAPPVVPSAQSLNSNPNRIFMGGSQFACDPLRDFGGVFNYGIAVTYVWAIVEPEGLDQDLPVADGPWPDADPSDAYYPSSIFDPGQLCQNVNQSIPPIEIATPDPSRLPYVIGEQG